MAKPLLFKVVPHLLKLKLSRRFSLADVSKRLCGDSPSTKIQFNMLSSPFYRQGDGDVSLPVLDS